MAEQFEIKIYSQVHSLKKIKEKLEKFETTNSNQVILDLLENDDDSRSIDPTILVAIVSSSSALIGILIGGLLKIFQNQKNQNIVFQSKSGAKLVIPADISSEKIKKYLKFIKEMDVTSIYL